METSAGIHAAAARLNTAGVWGARIAAQFSETVPIEARGPQMGVTEPLPHRILPVVGFCGHGFQLGPGVGDAMAELIATGATETPIEDFAIGRFSARPGA